MTVPFLGVGGVVQGGNDAFTKILLHFDGANGSTTITDVNKGGTAHAWTNNVGAISSSGPPNEPLFSSVYSCGAGTGWVDTPDSADFTVGSGDFTVDCRFFRSGGDGTNRVICGQSDNATTATTVSFYLKLDTTNKVYFTVASGAALTAVLGTTVFTAVGWNHIAGVRVGNILKLFVNGVQEGGDVAFSGVINNSANKFSVGRFGELASAQWNGFVEEFRLSVGIARWTANFVPPAGPYM